MTTIEAGASSADERVRIAALLARYPDLPAKDLDRIHHWFRKDATALDLGLLASDPSVHESYRAYRADHYDRIKPADLARAAIFIAGFALLILIIAWIIP
jgi:hypothetical protein